MTLWIIITGGLIGGILLFPLVQAWIGLNPPRHLSPHTPQDLGLPYQDITLTTKDEVNLSAWWIPAAKDTNTAVIIGHGYPMDKGNVLPLTAFLHDEHHLLYYDHRSFGESEGSTTLGRDETYDVETAITHALNRDEVTHVAAWGFSLSASTTLLTDDARTACTIAEAPFADIQTLLETHYKMLGPLKGPLARMTLWYARTLFKLDANDADLTQHLTPEGPPALLIHGENDKQIPPDHSQRIQHTLQDRATLWLVPNAGHGTAQHENPQAYQERIRTFLNTHLPTDTPP